MSEQTISSVVAFFKRKRNIVAIFVILLIVLSSTAVFFILSTDTERIVSGTLFIDSSPAPMGISVKIVFPDGEASDPDGTDELGRYRIDVTKFSNDTGTFFITYNGTTYIPKNQTGDYFDFNARDGPNEIAIDLFIYTLTDDTNDDTTDDGSSDDSSTDDTTGDDTTDDTTNDNTTDDTTDDGTSDNTTDDTTDDDTDDTTDDDTNDDSGDDTDDTTDDDDQVSTLTVRKYVWDNDTDTWTDEKSVESMGVLLCKIFVQYSGKNYVEDITITDQSPSGLEFIGNATVNGTISDPDIDSTNHTLSWSFTDIRLNDSMTILFNCTVNGTGTLESTVTVNATENTSKVFDITDSLAVKVFGDIEIEKQVWNNKTLTWVDECSMDLGEIARFKISIFYNGTFTVEDITITDMLPEGLDYLGDATVDGEIMEPVVDSLNHTLSWEISDVSSMELLVIEYDTNITQNATFTNTVRVTGLETIGKSFDTINSATVTGEAPKQITCLKEVRDSEGKWVNRIDSYVGSTASFRIILFNNGNRSFYNLNILDTLPDSLSYIIGSSMIFYNNQSFFEEPDSDEVNSQLLWSNVNTIIQNYLQPGENVSIVFNTTISDDGLLINQVDVTSTICDECDPLDLSDTAIINATIPIPQLNVDAGGPYTQRPGIPVILTALASGGSPPYTYLWDVNDDGLFDDGNKSEIVIQWNAEGNYTVHVKVVDSENTTDIDTTYVNISIPILMVDAGGPYTDFAGNVIEFYGMATGGTAGYTWHWDFGDGNTSSQQNPVYIYMEPGVYTAILTVTDSQNISKNDTAIVTVKERDTSPPVIEIEDPINALYINGRAVFPFFTPFVFGELQINISAVDEETSIEKMELHINDELIGTWYDSSIQWTWSERVFGRFRLYVVAYDEAGNYNEMELVVWKFF